MRKTKLMRDKGLGGKARRVEGRGLRKGTDRREGMGWDGKGREGKGEKH